jgi:ketosteroid isomerase-like protein
MAALTPREVVDRYFDAQARKDFDTIRTLIAEDVTFHGVLGTTDTVEAYIEGLRQATAAMTALERRVICVDGDEVCQVYEMTLSAPPVTLTVAQWLTVRDGKIATARVYFDPRPLLGG